MWLCRIVALNVENRPTPRLLLWWNLKLAASDRGNLHKRGSLGSQLMHAADGTYYAVARWPNRELWLRRSDPDPADAQASQSMGESIDISFPPIELDVTDDMLELDPHNI